MLRGGTGVLCWPCKGCSRFQDPQWTQPPTHQLLPGTGTPRRSRPRAAPGPVCPHVSPPSRRAQLLQGWEGAGWGGRGGGVCVYFFFFKGIFFFFFKAKTRSKGISTSSNRDHLVH